MRKKTASVHMFAVVDKVSSDHPTHSENAESKLTMAERENDVL